MTNSVENRREVRYQIPAVIEIPSLSEFPLVPEDVSAGGFCVTSGKCPPIGDLVRFSIQIAGETFGPCEARVVWRRREPVTAPLWRAGFLVEKVPGEEGRLRAALEDLSARMGGLMSPMAWI